MSEQEEVFHGIRFGDCEFSRIGNRVWLGRVSCEFVVKSNAR